MRTRLLVAVAVVVAAFAAPVPMAWGAPATRLAVLDDADEAVGEEVGFPASHVGVRWTGDDDAVVQLRWKAGGRWHDWRRVEVAHDLDDEARGLVYGGLVRSDGATRVQARVLAGTAGDLEIAALDTVRGPRRLAPVPARAAAAPAGSRERVAQPPVVTRAQWGADESLRASRPPSFAPVSKLVVHHTVTDNADPDPAATVRAIYAFHTRFRGWDDIGYNFLVDARGRTYEGRHARPYAPGEVPTGESVEGHGVVGAHTAGANTGSVGVALLGDFTTASPTPAAVGALQSMLSWKADRHDIDPTGASPYTRVSDGSVVTFPNIAGHRDATATRCPGDDLYARLPALRDAVARAVAGARPPTTGYWLARRDGAVHAFGSAPFLGDASGVRLNSPVRGVAATVTERGYWLLAGDGGVFSFGDARFHGSTGNIRLNKPVVGMAATPSGNGYWLVASDGGIFAFGDARFHGSTGNIRLNKPVVGMAATPTGNGYWLVASDGGIFAFGDAAFRGSTGAIRLNSPIVAMEASSNGGGYWLVARDGGVFAFHVPFLNSVPGLRLPSYAGSVALRATSAGRGYYVLGADGGVFAFGDAGFFGSRPGLSGPASAADLATVHATPPRR